MDKKPAFEEFQLFYESAEKVTERRISLNRWNYSICSAVLLAVAAIGKWTITTPAFFSVAVGICVVLSMMAALYCTLWIAQIRDFKRLNNAKFNVLNTMAPQMVFSSEPQDSRRSFEPFAREWEALQKGEALQEVTGINVIALKSSNIEYLIPKAFRVLFVLVICVAILAVILNWDVFVASLSLSVTPIPSTRG